MTIVKIKVFCGSEYTRGKNISIDRNELTQMTFIMFSCRVKQILCQESSSMRIQYKDDEQTFVTMTCNEDFEDALRCVEPIPNYDDAYRLTIRIDYSLTPTLKSPTKKKPCIVIKDGLSTKTTSAKAKSEDPNFPNSESKKRLSLRNLSTLARVHYVTTAIYE